MTAVQKASVVLIAFSISCSSTSVRKVEQDSQPPEAVILLEVYANGRDADLPPGPRLTEGETVEWTYVAVNAGTVELVDVMVEDSVWGPVSCSRPAINPGEQSLCSLAAQPPVGLFENTGTVTATAPDGGVVTASDPSHVLVDGIATLAPGEVSPVVCDTHLLMANPTRDSVTEVELVSRTVATRAVGDEPLDLVAAADCSVGVTLNDGGNSVSVIDFAGTATDLEVRPGRNRLDMSPDGSWVVVWADSTREGIGCVGAGTCPLGEISVVDVDNLTVESFATGLEPMDVLFTPDSGRAVLVAEQFFGVVELVTGSVTFARHGSGPGATDEALMGPNGDYVWQRHGGLLQVANLSTFAVNPLTIPPVSDIELSADGSELVAVLFDVNTVSIFDTADPLAPPDSESVMIGPPAQLRMAASGDGILFASDGSRDGIVVWLRGPGTSDSWPLVKPIRDAMLTPDGSAALVIHTLGDVDGANDEFTDEYVVSVVEMGSSPLSANTIVLPSRPLAWAISPTGGWGIVVTEESAEIVIVDFATVLTDVIDLPSPARFGGFLPNTGTVDDDVAWVSHAHDITFISPASGSVDTVAP